jgi:hypothetical protein
LDDPHNAGDPAGLQLDPLLEAAAGLRLLDRFDQAFPEALAQIGLAVRRGGPSARVGRQAKSLQRPSGARAALGQMCFQGGHLVFGLIPEKELRQIIEGVMSFGQPVRLHRTHS